MISGALSLHAEPPFRLDLTVWVLKRRDEYTLERWDGQTYRRALLIDRMAVDVAVQQIGPPDTPLLDVAFAVMGLEPNGDPAPLIADALRDLLGLEQDVSGFYALARQDPVLAPLAERFRGAKPTRYPTLFEALINAIACQQVTLTFGLRVVSRLIERFGTRLETHDGEVSAFPTPAQLAAADPETLRELGLSRQKARAVLELAEGLTDGSIDLSGVAALDDQDAIAALTELRGVGRWTAEYVLLRGLGRTHIFPGDDAGARNALERWLGSTERLSYDDVRSTLAGWKPYAGLIYFHMLLSGLAARGALPNIH